MVEYSSQNLETFSQHLDFKFWWEGDSNTADNWKKNPWNRLLSQNCFTHFHSLNKLWVLWKQESKSRCQKRLLGVFNSLDSSFPQSSEQNLQLIWPANCSCDQSQRWGCSGAAQCGPAGLESPGWLHLLCVLQGCSLCQGLLPLITESLTIQSQEQLQTGRHWPQLKVFGCS